MSDYRSCDWCGRSYNYLAIGGPQRNPYCSTKCYKESGAEERLEKRIIEERIAREAEEKRREEAKRKEEERWNSLSKEEQEAELETKRKEEEAKKKGKEAMDKVFLEAIEKDKEEQKNDWWIGILVVGLIILFIWVAF